MTRAGGPTLWLHAPDADAGLEVRTLMARLLKERDDLSFVLTTPAGVLPPALETTDRLEVRHEPLPDPQEGGISAFFHRWQPAAAIWLGEEPRRQIPDEAARRDVALFWADASVPDDHPPRLRLFARRRRQVLSRFRRILTVDARSARNLQRSGVAPERIEVCGRLQAGAPPPEHDEARRARFASALGARPVWAALGVAREEEDAVLAAHRAVLRRAHRLILILATDDPARAGALAKRLETEGWDCLHADDRLPGEETRILIADGTDEDGLWLRLAPLVFLGQTLARDRGAAPRDPTRAAALGSVPMHGPHTEPMARQFAHLDAAGAASLVFDAQGLSREVERLLAPDRAAEMARAAWDACTEGAQATDSLCESVLAALDERGV